MYQASLKAATHLGTCSVQLCTRSDTTSSLSIHHHKCHQQTHSSEVGKCGYTDLCTANHSADIAGLCKLIASMDRVFYCIHTVRKRA